jgi:hypothetical protein
MVNGENMQFLLLGDVIVLKFFFASAQAFGPGLYNSPKSSPFRGSGGFQGSSDMRHMMLSMPGIHPQQIPKCHCLLMFGMKNRPVPFFFLNVIQHFHPTPVNRK